MPRICFVIMPFSATDSCTEEEWTEIFEDVFKPGIESADLDYECDRSVATRGNIIGEIIRDLNDSYAVVADLTDRNANVFYELGVRHALQNRTIILAQKRGDIPFDLQAYASHVYDWRTQEGREALGVKLKELLQEIDSNPDRSDNPVSDFLGLIRTEDPNPISITPEESPHAQALVGQGAEGLDPARFARRLAHLENNRAARVVNRLTLAELTPLMNTVLGELNQREIPGSSPRTEVVGLAEPFISAVEPLVKPVEQFALTSVEEGWSPGAELGHRLAGNFISFGEQNRPGRNIRFARGTPGLLGWRLLILLGAKALADEEFDILRDVVLTPIEVEESSGRFSNRCLIQRRDLFWPEAYLGNANFGINYLIALWGNQPHLQHFFANEDDFHLALAQFLMIVALAYAKLEDERELYPGYRIVPQARRAMGALCSRLAANHEYRDSIARVIGLDSGITLNHNWTDLVTRANAVELGSQFFLREGIRFPDPMDKDAKA